MLLLFYFYQKFVHICFFLFIWFRLFYIKIQIFHFVELFRIYLYIIKINLFIVTLTHYTIPIIITEYVWTTLATMSDNASLLSGVVHARSSIACLFVCLLFNDASTLMGH